MELIFLRHAPAGDKKRWRRTGRPDGARPLTSTGRDAAKASAEALRRLVRRADVVATSPWKRALQTAKPAATALRAKLEETELLLPDASPADLASWLRARGAGRVVLVGHEPHMSAAASWLLTGSARAVLELKKAGALRLDAERPGSGTATLVWALPPKVLRKLR